MKKSMMRRAFTLLGAAPFEGAIVEFGVYQGDSLSYLGSLARQLPVPTPLLFGFDTFVGMPPSAHLNGPLAAHWGVGTFTDTTLGMVGQRLAKSRVEATLRPGLFAQQPPLRELAIDAVRLAHIDADLYESYRDALCLLTPCLRIGSVLVFDEVVPPPDPIVGPGVRAHGQRALREWEASTGLPLHLVRTDGTALLAVIADEQYLRHHARLLALLSPDSPLEWVKHWASPRLRRVST